MRFIVCPHLFAAPASMRGKIDMGRTGKTIASKSVGKPVAELRERGTECLKPAGEDHPSEMDSVSGRIYEAVQVCGLYSA